MRLVVMPGVFRPLSDSWMLARRLREELTPGASVADVCSGSGVLAVSAALAGAGAVTAVDVSRRAALTARLNARLNGVSIRALRGDLLDPVAGERFDIIVSNPPYVPADGDELPTRGPRRAWDAGRDGRALLDRICVEAPERLRPGGTVLIVHSSVCGADRTVEMLSERSLAAEVVGRDRGPLGPLLSTRAETLERRGLLAPGAREEEVVVIRARRSTADDGRLRGSRPGRLPRHG